MRTSVKDFVGNTVQVGDEVIIIENQYRNFQKATVLSISEQKVKLDISYMYGENKQSKMVKSTHRFDSEIMKVVKEIIVDSFAGLGPNIDPKDVPMEPVYDELLEILLSQRRI